VFLLFSLFAFLPPNLSLRVPRLTPRRTESPLRHLHEQVRTIAAAAQPHPPEPDGLQQDDELKDDHVAEISVGPDRRAPVRQLHREVHRLQRDGLCRIEVIESFRAHEGAEEVEDLIAPDERLRLLELAGEHGAAPQGPVGEECEHGLALTYRAVTFESRDHGL
jgi:hypothetical protein